ncbi:hypothetical protein, partial [Methanoculleus sp. MH98A]|uniref:hypothetical protein n=1 Tax=Methanoculleus sp. MH98A TaxID=1495314 RepID=UPI0012DF9F16
MKLSKHVRSHLAMMICGDKPYKKVFPYRNSSQLTSFFENLGLNYKHDDSLRRLWVSGVLAELDVNSNENDDSLSPELIAVIKALVNPDYYCDPYSNLDKAKKQLKTLLDDNNIAVPFNGDLLEVNRNRKRKNRSASSQSNEKQDDCLRIIPRFFKLPKKSVDQDQVSVMMPFSKDFQGVYDAIRSACASADFNSRRVDEVWNNSEIVQDIFELIFTSAIVIADFSQRNPNVFYEVGIAHTLGKEVIPIAQNEGDIPFDLHHHRVLLYHNNNEG